MTIPTTGISRSRWKPGELPGDAVATQGDDLRSTPRTGAGPKQPVDGGLVAAIRSVLAVPGMLWLALGYGASNMVLASLPVWSPAFRPSISHARLVWTK